MRERIGDVMGVWGYFQPPLEPSYGSDYERECDALDRDSEEEFIEREMSYADWLDDGMLDTWEDIASDEGGWGAWMGGEL